jgi:hypothetical protein
MGFLAYMKKWGSIFFMLFALVFAIIADSEIRCRYKLMESLDFFEQGKKFAGLKNLSDSVYLHSTPIKLYGSKCIKLFKKELLNKDSGLTREESLNLIENMINSLSFYSYYSENIKEMKNISNLLTEMEGQ